MPTFDFLPLVWWGLPVAAAPILIHLINLLRHRRVPWAAMEFLLASQKKYRTRILLKQWLLLLLRTLAIAGIVFALAQPRWRSALGSFFGGGSAHLVLLDDTVSMGDLTPDASGGPGPAFDRGRRVIERIADDLASGSGGTLAVGLFSEFGREGTLAIEAQEASPQTATRLRDSISRLRCSWAALGPAEVVARAAAASEQGDRTVWIVSDFRSRDWRGSEVADALRKLADGGGRIRLVDCGVDTAASNLSIERVEAVGGVPAEGVLLPIEVRVRNDGTSAARDVLVELREDGVSRPAVRISDIPPGSSVTRRFDSRFASVGGHTIDARLPADILPADDIRACVVDVVDRVEVLLVADDPGTSGRDGDAFYVAAALAPGAGAPTGLAPRIVAPSALPAMDLAPYDVIWVLDVARLDPAAVAALETHARAGGAVVFFCGPRTKAETVNSTLVRGGEGLFPLPLAGDVEVLPAPGPGRAPDIVVEDHPVVAVLAGQRNPLLDAVRLDRVMAIERGFDESSVPGLRRLLSLRTGGPLAVERPFGKGLVAAVFTTAAPTWNTWARGNPSWVVVMLELQNHLARGRRRAESLLVPEDLVVRLDAGIDESEIDFLVPPDGAVVRQLAKPVEGKLEARLRADVPGVYAARWRSLDGRERERLVAATIDPAEGRLERIARDQLDRELVGIPFRYDRAESLDPASDMLGGMPLTMPLLILLLAILFAEQIAAYAASYHTTGAGQARR
jgi:hypothetical protein